MGKTLGDDARQDKISKPQSGKQHLAEGAGVKDAFAAIQAFEGRRGKTAMMELAVVVIFDNPAALAIGPVEQGKTAFYGERHAQRILMRGCNEREPGVGRAARRAKPALRDRSLGG